MFIIMIRRFVRPDREREFLEAYRADLTNHPDFLGETLTKVSNDAAIPSPMSSLFSDAPPSLAYVNIARWKSWESFAGQCRMTPGWFDPEIEVAARERAVLEVVEDVLGGATS